MPSNLSHLHRCRFPCLGDGDIQIRETFHLLRRRQVLVFRPRKIKLLGLHKTWRLSAFEEDVIAKLPNRCQRNEIQLAPKPVQLRPPLGVQYQLVQRRVVTKIAGHQVETRTQKPPLVPIFLCQEHAATFGDVERVGYHGAKLLHGLTKCRDLAIIVRIRREFAFPAIGCHRAIFQQDHWLRTTLDHAGHDRKFRHLPFLPFLANPVGQRRTCLLRCQFFLRFGGGQRPPPFPEFGRRPGGRLLRNVCASQQSQEFGQVTCTDLGFPGHGFDRHLRLPQPLSMAVRPSRLQVTGVIGWLSPVEVDDPLNAELISIGVRDDRMRRKRYGIVCQHEVIGHAPSRSQVFVQQRRSHRQRLPTVVKSRFVGRIQRKFASRTDVHSGQITNRVVVFGIAQATSQNRPRISGVAIRFVSP